MRMGGNSKSTLAMDLVNYALRILVGIDCFLQINAEDVVIFKQITDLQARNHQEMVGLLGPARNLFNLLEIAFQILDRLSFIVEFETSWGLGVKQMVCDSDGIKACFSINLYHFFYRDGPIAPCGMDVEVGQ